MPPSAAPSACGAVCQALRAWHSWETSRLRQDGMEKRVSPLRGARQPRRRPHAADCALARRQVRFARAKMGSVDQGSHFTSRPGVSRGRADAKRPRCMPAVHRVRSGTTAPQLSRPSMGRDTPTLPLNKHCQRQGGQMLGSMARPARRGHRRHVYEGAGRGPPALRGRTLTGSPLNSGRPGPGFRRSAMPESQASAHPGASAMYPRGTPGAQCLATAPQAYSATERCHTKGANGCG